MLITPEIIACARAARNKKEGSPFLISNTKAIGRNHAFAVIATYEPEIETLDREVLLEADEFLKVMAMTPGISIQEYDDAIIADTETCRITFEESSQTFHNPEGTLKELSDPPAAAKIQCSLSALENLIKCLRHAACSTPLDSVLIAINKDGSLLAIGILRPRTPGSKVTGYLTRALSEKPRETPSPTSGTCVPPA
jgi:hypothetical protein